MRRWLRRLRGAVGTALVWASGWAGTGLLLSLTGLFGSLAAVEYVVFAGVFAVMGFISGAAFSSILAIAERSRTFDQMSLPRFAGWGAVGGILLQLVFVALGQGTGPILLAMCALLGSGSAAGSLALARRAKLGPGVAGQSVLPADEASPLIGGD